MFSKDIAGLGPLRGIVQGNVSIDILQQYIHTSLPDAGQEKEEKVQTNYLIWGIYQTLTDDKVGPIILALQMYSRYLSRTTETLSGNSELKNSLNTCPGAWALKIEGIVYHYQGSSG